MKTRTETDSMGEVELSGDAYFGPQTQRAINNFTISSLKFHPLFLHAIALVKKYAAQVNESLKILDSKMARAIVTAADEVMAGRFENQFSVDVFQTGSGTSTNMNMNEVIAARANEILTGKVKNKSPVHPNDHVNLCQSSNDVIPTAIHISGLQLINHRLIPALNLLKDELDKKQKMFVDIPKIGRTHLQDAVPVTLGEEFAGYARQIELGIQRMASPRRELSSLALGGTAVGTGLNAHPQFARKVIALIADDTGIPFSESPNHFESQSSCDAAVETSGTLKTIAVSMTKIANDIRWLASGPRCGLGEINIPPLQPGSSIMPGKVNPVIPEAVIQACAQVTANDTAVTLGGRGGCFELNTMLPLVSYNLLQSIALLSGAAETLARKCVSGITANKDRCEKTIQQSLAIVTNLVPYTGYDKAARLAQKAYNENRSIEDVAVEENVLPKERLLKVLYGRQ